MTASSEVGSRRYAPSPADSARFWWVLSIALALCAAFAIAPTSREVLRQLVLRPTTGTIAVASVVVGVHRYRPAARHAWLLLGGGLLATLIANVIAGAYLVLDRDPFPSPADVFYVAGYPLLAAGLVAAIRERKQFGLDSRAAIDAGIATVVAGLVAWVYVIQPVLDHDLPTYETVVTIVYPILDLLLLATAARFVMGASWRVRALWMVVVGLSVILVGDMLFAYASASGADLRASDVALMVGNVFVGVAALSPTMRALTEEGGDPGGTITRGRAVLMTSAALVPALILIIQALRGESLYLLANVVATIVLVALVALRFQYIASRAQRSATDESVLNLYTADLLAAEDRDEIVAAAERALVTLTHDGKLRASLVLDPELAARPPSAGLVVAITVQGEPVGMVVADASIPRLRQRRVAIETIAAQLSIALERDRLRAHEQALAASLAEQNEQLRELDSMKDRFVSSVSHELRTPLTSMLGYLEILRDGEVGDLNEEQAHVVEIIDRNCARLVDLIGDLLVTAQFDSGRVTLTLTTVDLVQLATTQVESIQAFAAARDVAVLLMTSEDRVPVHGDEMRLGQLLDNLLSNAVKFTTDGGSVTVSIGVRDDVASLEVADTGVGMPPDVLDKIFGRFYRAPTVGTIAGTGLGLSIARSIVEAHDGTIAVSSEVGVGTTMRVELPLTTGVAETTLAPTNEVTT